MNNLLKNPATGVTAVLGPTNTGKTHLAIERMLAYPSGIIGLPLRLLAREIYDRICAKIGREKVSLITGEEKIVEAGAPYCVCTVEAMGRETKVAYVAIDEVQLAADFERGHIFTDRILHLRGTQETMLLGAATMRPILQKLLPDLDVQSRPRLSRLSYQGAKKMTRLPRRSCIVAFSSDEVYAIAEFIRRQRGGAAVVLGALSPRSRNAQVALYQSGEVDFLIATDAIGMGLNLDVDHVAFAGVRKFDGYQYRALNAAELGQIAGRAGRHLRDGSFGVTARVEPFDGELVEQLEEHRFAPVKCLQWRSHELDFSTVTALKRSLEKPASREGLVKALPATDARALEYLMHDEEIMALAKGSEGIQLLWDVCALPDYRRISPAQHGDLIARLYRDLRCEGKINEDYLSRQVALADTVEGDIDTLSHRIAHIRSWTYIANRSHWLKNPQEWREKTRAIEDKLSDALHQCLTQRFVNRTTSLLMKRLRENAMIEAEILGNGDVLVEGHIIGQLQGFRFKAMDQRDLANGEGENRFDAKALRNTAQKILSGEYERRASRLALCANGDLAIGSDGVVRWLGAAVASLVEGMDFLHPKVILLADEELNGAARANVVERLERFVAYHFETALKALFELAALHNSKDDAAISATSRGIAYQLVEKYGLLKRRDVADTIKNLEQKERSLLRECGVRFGTYHIFIPSLLKPQPAQALTLLWALKHDAKDEVGYGDVIAACAAGRTSLVVDNSFKPQFYNLAGYQIFGRRAVRLDSLEKLADLIRQALNWREGETKGERPAAFYDNKQFLVSNQMLSSLGVSHADMEEILKKLGYRYHSVLEAQLAEKMTEMVPAEELLPQAECVGPIWVEEFAVKKEQTDKIEQFLKSVKRFSDKNCGENKDLEQSVEPSETKNALEEIVPEKTVQLWQYHHKREENRHRRPKPRLTSQSLKQQPEEALDKNKRPHKKGGNRYKDTKPSQGKQHNYMQKRPIKRQGEKTIDPDSPFAKLAALREQMKK